MISKSTIAATVLVSMGLASPAFAQGPLPYDYGYAGPYTYYPYERPMYFGWAPYGYGGWPSSSPGSIANNIHTPPNH
jgi:hypothetical protein